MTPHEQAVHAAARAPISAPPADFRHAGHALVDAIAEFLESLPDRPLTTPASPAELRRVLHADRALPEDGAAMEPLLASAAQLLFDHSLFNGHPRFFGYITSSPAPIGMLADLLAADVNPNVGARQLSPMATEIETQAVRWVAELIGYPTPTGGLFVSGGNMANIVGLFAARAAAADWDVRAEGVAAPNARPLRVYATRETHTWLQKATDLAGLGTASIRWIPTDGSQRLDTRALRSAIEEDRAAGALPMMVVGTAGTVSTGAVDPLGEIGAICRDTGIWFHVDGAYGALAAAVPGTSPDLRHLSGADSVAVDPHKWLYMPMEAGCVLVRDAEALRNAFAYHPPYYHFGEPALNYVDYGPQNSRGFRALKVWLALQQAGRGGYVQMMREDIRLSQRFHQLVGEHPELEALSQQLSINTFRYVPPERRDRRAEPDTAEYLNTLNQKLLDRIQVSGEAFVSNAVIDGRYMLRACIVNFNTTEADIEAMPEIVARLGREAHAELDAAGSGAGAGTS